MTSQIHLENFVETSSSLPAELVRLLATIKDLDERSQSTHMIDVLCAANALLRLPKRHVAQCRQPPPSQRTPRSFNLQKFGRIRLTTLRVLVGLQSCRSA